MELFPDGGFVRLQSRARRTYVHADGDGQEVSLRPNGPVPSLNAVWRVEHWVSPNQGGTFVLLQNAAYGRYLSFSVKKAPLGHRGRRTTQRDRNEPHVMDNYPWMWRVERLDPPDNDYVRLRFFLGNLRANGRYLTWNIGVTVDIEPGPRITTMMQWAVHAVEASPLPQSLPLTPEDEGGSYPHPPRMIWHVRASDEGNFDQNHYNWPWFFFYGSSLYMLGYMLGQRQYDWNEDVFAFTLCMRPGSHGRLMPLVTDLPANSDSMSIVVLRTGSPAAAALVYPAPTPTVDE